MAEAESHAVECSAIHRMLVEEQPRIRRKTWWFEAVHELESHDVVGSKEIAHGLEPIGATLLVRNQVPVAVDWLILVGEQHIFLIRQPGHSLTFLLLCAMVC